MSDRELSREEAEAGTAEAEPADAGTPVEDEVVESQLDAALREAAEFRDLAQRLQAEFENYRKRSLRDQQTAGERAAEPLVRELLEVLDEFELAMMAAERQPDFELFHRGVELVFAKLANTLRSFGVEKIEAEGSNFDPELHEALMQTGEGDGEPIVAEVMRNGYTLKGRVIRPAGVKVTLER